MALPELSLVISAIVALQSAPIHNDVDSISVSGKPGVYYIALRETAEYLGVPVEYYDETGAITINSFEIDPEKVYRVADGTAFVPARTFGISPIEVDYDPETEKATLKTEAREVTVSLGKKFVEISLAEQRLRAWQGKYIVFETNVSTGRYRGSTPTGQWEAGPVKKRMHYSSIYNNSPMPYSIQIVGNIFMHGYTSVPRHPASHGCIRLPLTGINPARWLFNWVSIGTPVAISSDWTYDPTIVASD